ncbi:FAM208B isoform X1 [Sigmodon hispidus]
MAAPIYKSILEINKNALISPWKGQLIIQGCLLCDITLWSPGGTVIPVQLPQELDFKYVMKVSSLKESLPEAAFKRQNYSEQKVCCQDLCFDLYEVELSNKQGENTDKLVEYIKNKQLAIIKCLEDRGFFILLTSSALTPEPDFGDEQTGLHGLHLFHSPQSAGAKDLKVEDDISLKVISILPALSCALLEAKKSLLEKEIPPNILVKHSFQDLYKVDKSLSLMAPQDGMRNTEFTGKRAHAFDSAPPLEKCPSESLMQLKSYFSDPTGYTLDLSTALDLLVEHPQFPCISDAGFSLVMTPNTEFLDSEMEIRKETETTKKKSGKTLRVKKRAVVPLSPASNLRVQPKRKASTSAIVLPNKRVSLGRSLSKRTAPRADSGSCNSTLTLVKGQFTQKRTIGNSILSKEYAQKTRLDRKKREASVSKDASLATNAKRAKKQEKSPGRVLSRPKPPLKKSPQKQKVNVTRGHRNARTRKQPQPDFFYIALHLHSEITSNGHEDGINLQENIAMISKGFPENSVINCDSQALNMLADLALSSAASSITSCKLRNLSCFSQLPQNNVLLSKENVLHNTSDHEYYKGVKNQKGVLLPKPSSDEKINSESDLTVSQEENLIPYAQPLAVTQRPKEAQEPLDANQNSVAVEHSYALLLAEQSKKQLHQRKLPSPAFAKNGAKGPEAGTPIGKVMPFRHLQNTSPLQKLSEDSLTKRKSLFVSSNLKDFLHSHTVLSCDGSFKITFKCEGEYVFSLDSKYTSNSLEKTVVRALHGPWNTDLPESMEDVKLLLHMWIALFYKEVSPASSPDPIVQTDETKPSSYCLELHGTQPEKKKFSQVKSGEILEKENSFVDPTTSVGQDKLTQEQVQFSAETPQILSNAGLGGRVTVPGEITEFSVPSEHNEGLSFSEKVQCYETELNKPTSPPRYGGNFEPLEKTIKSGNSLQAVCMENRNLDIKSLTLDSSASSRSPRKVVENKPLIDTLVSITTVSEIGNVSVKQTNSKNKKNVCDNDLKIDDINMQSGSMNSASIDKTDIQAYMHPEISKFVSSDTAQGTYYTKPVSVEPEFQTQEIPEVRMDSLLQNIGTELYEERMDLNAVDLHSDSTSTKGEQKIHVLQDTSKCEEKPLNDGVLFQNGHSDQNTGDISKSINEEPSASFVPEPIEFVCGVYKENIVSENPIMGHKTKADSETLSRNAEITVNASVCCGPLSGDTDQDTLDCRNWKLDVENLCTLKSSQTSQKDAIKDSNDSSTGLHNSDDDMWVYCSKNSELETHFSPRSWDTEPCPISANKCMPHYIQIPDSHGIPRTYANFTITKESKETRRTLHSLKRHRNFTSNCSLLSSWTNTWHVADDLTQNTLDLEYLRFDHKLKQIIKKRGSQQSSPSSNIFPKESLIQISVGTCPSTKTSDASLLHFPPKSRSPILVTVVHAGNRQQSHCRRGHSARNLDSSSSAWKEKCNQGRNLTNSERNPTVPVHLNKLKYNSTLKEARNDISLILNEYAEFNKVMMNSNQIVSQDKELSVASADSVSQDMCQPRQSVSYKDVITDLCATLHIKLKGVMREACKSPFWFYLVESEDKSFFLRTKSVLKKGGHTEIELLDFCQAFHRESETLLVIIKNEDIISHLHQIPSLLKLKHFPNVVFAGLDTPEDILNDTYQELFRSGGFVVSDDDILESLTLVQLKEIVKILEKLNENGRWKWLLHYRENKKLKEKVRVDSIAHKKNLILKSYQSVNIIELLHYHNCDSPSPSKAEISKCLLNLQIQHISSRFPVFLTDKPTVSTEFFENNGILVTDVNYFTENIQKIAAPFRSSYW